MPFIQTKVSGTITEEKETILKEKFGKAIELLPGKTENWLMLSFEDQCRLYFRGSKEEAAAFVEVKLFGKAERSNYDALTAAVTKILSEELAISPSRIYVRYDETATWGWNGSNF